MWTNREATNLVGIPERVVVIGGGAVGVELGRFLAPMGARVTIFEGAGRLVPREHPRVGELTRDVLEGDGIDVRTGVQTRRVLRAGSATAVEADDGSRVATDVVLLATGRRPRTADLGLEAAGATLDPRGAVVVDERCRAAPCLWALGDATGVALFTHVATDQGRVVADNILGRTPTARYEGIPRVVLADSEIAAVGQDLTETEIDLAGSIARPFTTRPSRAGTSGSSPTAGARCSSGPGRSYPWPGSGSTRPRSPSAPRSPSTSSATR